MGRPAASSAAMSVSSSERVMGAAAVPSEAATLEGAAVALTLDCYHSGGSADAWPQDEWYGAERNVDAWLGRVAEQIDRQTSLAAT